MSTVLQLAGTFYEGKGAGGARVHGERSIEHPELACGQTRTSYLAHSHARGVHHTRLLCTVKHGDASEFRGERQRDPRAYTVGRRNAHGESAERVLHFLLLCLQLDGDCAVNVRLVETWESCMDV